MGLEKRIATLSPGQIAAVKDCENELAARFENPVILLVLDNTK